MRKNLKHNKGLTLMELTIVLGIMVIIAAIAIPLFLLSTDRARLRGDIQSARVIQNAIDLHIVERGAPPQGSSVNDMINDLAGKGYLNARNTTIQTNGAVWVRDASTSVIKVDIGGANVAEEIHRAYTSLPEDEREFVLRGRIISND